MEFNLPQLATLPVSKAQVIWNSFQRKEISQDDCDKFMALLISETCIDYAPIEYFIPSPNLTDYIKKRSSNFIPRDKETAVKNGEWLQATVKLQIKNHSNYDLLIWAGRICKKLSAEDACTIIRNMVYKHIEIDEHQFPHETYRNGMKAQELDSSESRRSLPAARSRN